MVVLLWLVSNHSLFLPLSFPWSFLPINLLSFHFDSLHFISLSVFPSVGLFIPTQPTQADLFSGSPRWTLVILSPRLSAIP